MYLNHMNDPVCDQFVEINRDKRRKEKAWNYKIKQKKKVKRVQKICPLFFWL